MLEVVENFYRGMGSRYELESALENWRETVEDYENRGVYEGDSYYQEALGIKREIEEALESFDSYYDEEGNFIGEN